MKKFTLLITIFTTVLSIGIFSVKGQLLLDENFAYPVGIFSQPMDGQLIPEVEHNPLPLIMEVLHLLATLIPALAMLPWSITREKMIIKPIQSSPLELYILPSW